MLFESNATLRDKLLFFSIFLTLGLAYVGFDAAIIEKYSPVGVDFYISSTLTLLVFLFITYQNIINTMRGRTLGTSRKLEGNQLVWLGRFPVLQGLTNRVVIWLLLIMSTIVYGIFCILAYFYGFAFLLNKLTS